MIEYVARLVRKGSTMKPTATWPKVCCGRHMKALGKRKYRCVGACGKERDLETWRFS